MSDYNPALTAQEWAAIQAQGVDWSGYKMTRQQIAALALHGQPFGFSREDIDALRLGAEQLRKAKGPDGLPVAWPTTTAGIDSVADRIEALLPPESVG